MKAVILARGLGTRMRRADSGASLSAERRAPRFIFLFTRMSWSRGRGPCTTPPPVHWGERVDPCRGQLAEHLTLTRVRDGSWWIHVQLRDPDRGHDREGVHSRPEPAKRLQQLRTPGLASHHDRLHDGDRLADVTDPIGRRGACFTHWVNLADISL